MKRETKPMADLIAQLAGREPVARGNAVQAGLFWLLAAAALVIFAVAVVQGVTL